MGLSRERAALWHALGMGPVWRARNAAASGDAAGARSQSLALLDWDETEQAVAQCRDCPLCETRTQTVFGVGSRNASWMFIGEAPGAEEDARGEPFVGQAGRLLDNMLAAAGLGRDREGAQAVYIANVLKCRPPGNRNPQAPELAACTPFLLRQIQLLQPRIIVVMGRFAAQSLLATDASIGSLRGRVHAYDCANRRIPVIVTYHPAYLLRTLAEKSKAWDDLCLARATFAASAS